MMPSYLVIIHELLAMALFYTCFARAVKTSAETTRMSILFSFWLMGVASIALIAAPIVLPDWSPDPVFLLFLASVVTVQWVTSGLWKHGPPRQFRRPENEEYQ